MCQPPPRSTLFPYTTLFRSAVLQRVKATSKEMKRKRAERESWGVFASFLRFGQRYRSWSGTEPVAGQDRKSTRLNSSHANISYAVFCLKKKRKKRLGMSKHV